MAPFRNFLTKRSAGLNGGEAGNGSDSNRASSDSNRPSPLSVKESNDNPPDEYKLSVVDDNGVYLPPSPPEKPSFWRRYPGSAWSSNHRNLVNENEPFSISRESFDSYRRSFDISARSPVSYTDTMPSRTSLDSRITSPSTMHVGSFEKPESMEEECFEDVGLEEEEAKPKKKSLLSRFGDFSSDSQTSDSSPKSSQSHLGFRLPGRKRGQSGGGSELGATKPKIHVGEAKEP